MSYMVTWVEKVKRPPRDVSHATMPHSACDERGIASAGTRDGSGLATRCEVRAGLARDRSRSGDVGMT